MDDSGRSNIHPEHLDSYYNVSSTKSIIRHLLKFLFFADLGLALGLGRKCNTETDFYVGFGIGIGNQGVVFFLLSSLFFNQCRKREQRIFRVLHSFSLAAKNDLL